MNLEEKLKANGWGYTADDEKEVIYVEDAIEICQQEIAEACKKQREICAQEYLRDKGYSDITQSVISTIILNAPSPKEKL